MPRQAEVEKRSQFFVLASACLIVAALYFARDLVIPLALSVLVAFLLTPVVNQLERWRIGRTMAVSIVVALSFGVATGIGWVVERQIVDVVQQLPNYKSDINAKLASLRHSGSMLQKAIQDVRDVGTAMTAKQPASQPATRATNAPSDDDQQNGGQSHPQSEYSSSWSPDNPLAVRDYPPPSSAFSSIVEIIESVLGPLTMAGAVTVFVIFMLLAREDLRDRMIRLIGHHHLNVTTQALDEVGHRISRYLLANAIINVCVGILVAIGLWLVGRFIGENPSGFPSVILWGLLVCLLRFIPYVGIWIAAAFPLILSFALFKGSGAFVATIVMLAVVEGSVAQFIEPHLYGSTTGMSPLAVLVAAVFWTWLWGPIGLLLSTPLTSCVVVLGKFFPPMRFLDILLGDEPVLAPPLRLYQRLIALDQEEAAEVARDFLETHSLEETFDQVVLPALAAAERDRYEGYLDDKHHAFVRQGIGDMIEELADDARAKRIREQAAAVERSAREGVPAPTNPKRTIIPSGFAISVLLLPARDEADELCAKMLEQLLNLRGYCARSMTADALASEMINEAGGDESDIVCISALPPAAVAHARYLGKRLKIKYPERRLVVGLWTQDKEIERARRRIFDNASVQYAASMAGAQDLIDQEMQPLRFASSNGKTPAATGDKTIQPSAVPQPS